MFRTTALATLSALALTGCVATSASAQYPYGNLDGGYSHGYSYRHYDHGCLPHYDSHHQYHHGFEDYLGYGNFAYPNIAPSRHHAIPIYAESACPYGSDAICSEPIRCPFPGGETFPTPLTDDYQPGFGLGTPGHNHSHSGESHNGQSHDGHSHDHQIPSRDLVPSDRSYVVPPSLPRDSIRDVRPQQDFRREQRQQDDSIRMDSPPPPSIEPNSPSSPRDSNPRRFDFPPPSTV